MARHLCFLCLISLVILGASVGQDPVMMVEVTSNDPDTALRVGVENFVVDGVVQEEVELETPFNLLVSSRDFEMTLKLIEGESTFIAKTMRKGERRWVEDGLTGIGKLVSFSHREDSGSVDAKQVQ